MAKTRNFLTGLAMLSAAACAAAEKAPEDYRFGHGGVAAAAAQEGVPPPADAPYRNAALPAERRAADLMPRLTAAEKVRVLRMTACQSAGDIPRIGLAAFRTLDGPNGPRTDDRPVTYLPAPIAYAASWDRELVREIGRVQGEETRGVYKSHETPARVLFGPTINIARTPLGGRSFENFGEDPVLAGETAAAYCRGVQGAGVAACPKHWLLNDQEWCRTVIDVDVPERALREIYARPFEIAVKKADPWAVMNSYNAVRGVFAAWNAPLHDLLFGFGFSGAVYADWGGFRDFTKAWNGGTTFETDVSSRDEPTTQRLVKQLADGGFDRARFDEAVRRALVHYFRIGAFDRDTPEEKRLQARCEQSFGGADHAAVARRAAAESLVLLKNDGAFLPLDRTRIRKVAVIGPGADQRYSLASGHKVHQCGGAAAILPIAEPTPLEACVAAFGRGNVVYAPGFRYDVKSRRSTVPPMVERDPVAAAKEADVVLFFGGTDHSYDHEAAGWGVVPNADKPGLDLKGPQAELIARVAAANPNVVVCLNLGAPVSVQPWLASVKAVLVTWYAGQFGAEATLDALLGKVNPSGKLPYTFGRRLEDWPCHRMGEDVYPGRIGEWPAKVNGLSLFAKETYADGIWVGYRGFDRDGIRPEFAFGHGLSYTSFEIASAPARGDGTKAVRVKNVGGRAGRCVVQCYVTKTAPGVEMPAKELVDFASVTLAAGEEKTVAFRPEPEWLRYWDERSGKWAQAPRGVLRIGEASDRLTVQMEL